MEDQIRRKNFDQICRLCLEYASNMNALIPLFINEQNVPGYYGRFLKEFKESIPEIISACIGIEINPSEKLPMSICSGCEKQLIISNNFRQKCLLSNNYLLELQLTPEDEDDFDTDDDAPLKSLKPPELILLDSIKDNQNKDVEMDSSCDSVWNTLETQLNDDDSTTIDLQIKTMDEESENASSTKKTAVKKSKTVPLITPSTPIVSVNCSESVNGRKLLLSKDPTLKQSYTKKQKMCTICGMMVNRLRDHMKSHPNALEYSCSHCPRRYLTKKGLIKHISIQHTEDSDQSCDYEYYYNKNGEKTLRKPLAKPHKWKRNVAKTQRNFGQRYISSKGIERPEKKVKEPCNNICRLKCTEKITQIQREEIFKSFWNLCDLTQKRVFLIRRIERIIPKYRRSNGLRSLNYAYFFEIDDNRIQVCKTFFTKTLDISHVFIKTAINKLNCEKGCLEGERRGKCKKVKI